MGMGEKTDAPAEVARQAGDTVPDEVVAAGRHDLPMPIEPWVDWVED